MKRSGHRNTKEVHHGARLVPGGKPGQYSQENHIHGGHVEQHEKEDHKEQRSKDRLVLFLLFFFLFALPPQEAPAGEGPTDPPAEAVPEVGAAVGISGALPHTWLDRLQPRCDHLLLLLLRLLLRLGLLRLPRILHGLR